MSDEAREIEVVWSAKEMQNLGNSILDLEETLQEWEAEHGIKISDLLLTIESSGDLVDEPVRPLGLVSMRDKGETTIQYEVLNAQIGIL